MIEHEGFLRSIDEAPDDDATRLIYADWLEDYGDPARAEFIRAQVSLARLPQWAPERFDLEERSLDLLAEHRTRWLARLPEWARGWWWEFRRGLPEFVRLSGSVFAAHAEELRSLALIRGLQFDDWSIGPEELARLTTPLRIIDLRLLSRSGLRPFVAHLASSRLRRLSVSISIFDQTEPLAEWPGLARLTELDTPSSPDGEAILSSPHLGRLERLGLFGCRLTERAGRLLARSERLAGLRALDVSHNDLRLGDLAGAEWPALTRFSTYLRTDAGDIRKFLASRWASGLWSLVLRERNEESADLLAGYRPARLADLWLNNVRLGADGVAKLAAADWLSRLDRLGLWTCHVGAAGMIALSRSPNLGRLTRIDFRERIPAGVVSSLVDSERLPALCELLLSDMGEGSCPTRTLASASGLARFRYLQLSSARIGDAGAAALARAPLHRLRRLGLHHNDLTDAGVHSLLEAGWLPTLRELRLGYNSISAVGVQSLAACAGLSRLRYLDLEYNRDIGDAGAVALAESPHLGQLLHLSLPRWGVSDATQQRLRERFGAGVKFCG
jgi:uncharacterized protein (TIGR02996 family)